MRREHPGDCHRRHELAKALTVITVKSGRDFTPETISRKQRSCSQLLALF
jgi:hypothetical protein